MIHSHSTFTDDDPKPDLTPLLDIIFIVMVFLLLTANITVKSMEVSIPETDNTNVLAEATKEIITVNIMPQAPLWAIDGEAYESWDRFTHQLLAQVKHHPEHVLILSPDKEARVDSMLKVLAFLQNHNIDSTNIMMKESKK